MIATNMTTLITTATTTVTATITTTSSSTNNNNTNGKFSGSWVVAVIVVGGNYHGAAEVSWHVALWVDAAPVRITNPRH